MTSIEAVGGLQEEINNAHTLLEQDVRGARECAVDSLALLIKLRADLITRLGSSAGEVRAGFQVLVQDLDEDILLYREAVGHIVAAEAFVDAASSRQPE